MQVQDVLKELLFQTSYFRQGGTHLLYINTTNNSITIWEINRALRDPKSRISANIIANLRDSQPQKIKSTNNGIWIGPFSKFEALGFALHLNNKLFEEEKKTFSIDFSKI